MWMDFFISFVFVCLKNQLFAFCDFASFFRIVVASLTTHTKQTCVPDSFHVDGRWLEAYVHWRRIDNAKACVTMPMKAVCGRSTLVVGYRDLKKSASHNNTSWLFDIDFGVLLLFLGFILQIFGLRLGIGFLKHKQLIFLFSKLMIYRQRSVCESPEISVWDLRNLSVCP